jgi:hypothetical protein
MNQYFTQTSGLRNRKFRLLSKRTRTTGEWGVEMSKQEKKSGPAQKQGYT